MDETNPFGLFLVTSGSKGDRLLFRYPYEVPVNKSSSAESKYFSWILKLLVGIELFSINS